MNLGYEAYVEHGMHRGGLKQKALVIYCSPQFRILNCVRLGLGVVNLLYVAHSCAPGSIDVGYGRISNGIRAVTRRNVALPRWPSLCHCIVLPVASSYYCTQYLPNEVSANWFDVIVRKTDRRLRTTGSIF